ncbi:MAG: hypothetical protein ACREUF_09460 [Solimonas sp.]
MCATWVAMVYSYWNAIRPKKAATQYQTLNRVVVFICFICIAVAPVQF